MASGKNFLVGVFDDEDVLMDAISRVRTSGVKIHEVYTPFPVHGLDTALGYKPSNLPVAAFLYGMTGTILALTMQIGMLGIDWPIDIGGKPYIPLPSFIPISFELTVFCAAHGMALTFFIVSSLYPGKKAKMFDKRSTDDKFVMAIDLDKNKTEKANISRLLQDSGAIEINSQTL